MKLKVVDAALKRYNANSRDKHVGDCVPRSISLAFGEDYDQVRKDLNKIVREERPYSKFNSYTVFKVYLERHGCAFTKYPDDNTTEEEFCRKHPEGTYLLLTGDEKHAIKGQSTHMVCIIDGDIYDSWDSSDYEVIQWAKVTSSSTEFSGVKYTDILDDVMDFVDGYLQKLGSKFKYGNMEIKDIGENVQEYGGVDDYTFEFRILIHFNDDVPEDPYSRRLRGKTIGHYFYVKINPKWDTDKNIETQKKKLKQRIYDWVYNIRKELQDLEATEDIEVNPNFRGRRSDLMKLPEWVRPLVLSFDTTGWYGHQYDIFFEPLPEDPESGEVNTYGDTLKELRNNLEEYREYFWRDF